MRYTVSSSLTLTLSCVPEMWDIVELGDNSMQQFWASESILSLNLRREVPKNDDGGLIRSNKNRSNKQLKVVQPCRVAKDQLSLAA